MDFGNRLRNAREKQGFTLDDVEQETKIRKLYLKAIEDENFSILPPRVYATGFVKRYAAFLGLDEYETVEQYKTLAYSAEEAEDQASQNYQAPVRANERLGDKHFSLKNLLAAVVFVVIVVWTGNALVGYLANRETPSPERNQQIAKQPTTQKNAPKNPTKPDSKATVKITANQKCWVQIKVDDTNKFEGTLEPSETRNFTGKSKVYIHAGNAGGLSVVLNGKTIEALGDNGEVVEYELLKDGTVRKL